MRKLRKRGALIIEFLAVLPVFMLLMWIVAQLILFVESTSTMQEAAIEASNAASMQARSQGTLLFANNDSLQEAVKSKIQSSVSYDGYIDILDSTGNLYSSGPKSVLYIWDSEQNCISAMSNSNYPNVICGYTKTFGTSTNGIPHQDIYVQVKSAFRVLGNFGDMDQNGNPIAGHLEPFVYGSGLSELDTAASSQYYTGGGGS